MIKHNTSIPLKRGTSCLFIKLKLGRVGMSRVLHHGPSWHGPSIMWAELAWVELVLGRVILHPSLQSLKVPYSSDTENGMQQPKAKKRFPGSRTFLFDVKVNAEPVSTNLRPNLRVHCAMANMNLMYTKHF